MQPKYPEVKVRLALNGPSGNAFCILSQVTNAMRNAGIHAAGIEQYHIEARKSHYANLVLTTLLYVNVVFVRPIPKFVYRLRRQIHVSDVRSDG